MRIPESELIINSDGSVFHIHIRPDQLADKVILVGDPGRVEMFRPLLEKVECEGASREFVWITGRYNSERVTVLSTGIGTDNIDIVMTELDALANVDFTTREVKPEHRVSRSIEKLCVQVLLDNSVRGTMATSATDSTPIDVEIKCC